MAKENGIILSTLVLDITHRMHLLHTAVAIHVAENIKGNIQIILIT